MRYIELVKSNNKFLEDTMEEINGKQSIKTHIMDATEVNAQHALELEQASKERRMRSKEQIKAEVIGNNNIDYKKHMQWVDE